jgi:hypothetical protein
MRKRADSSSLVLWISTGVVAITAMTLTSERWSASQPAYRKSKPIPISGQARIPNPENPTLNLHAAGNESQPGFGLYRLLLDRSAAISGARSAQLCA